MILTPEITVEFVDQRTNVDKLLTEIIVGSDDDKLRWAVVSTVEAPSRIGMVFVAGGMMNICRTPVEARLMVVAPVIALVVSVVCWIEYTALVLVT